MEQPFINKVAESGLITLDPAEYYPTETIRLFDLKDHLFMNLILKEKDFRAALQNTDWYVSRHQEQVSLGLQTTLSQQQYEELLTYRQALRDLGASYNLEVTLPIAITWPNKPSWMNA